MYLLYILIVFYILGYMKYLVAAYNIIYSIILSYLAHFYWLIFSMQIIFLSFFSYMVIAYCWQTLWNFAGYRTFWMLFLKKAFIGKCYEEEKTNKHVATVPGAGPSWSQEQRASPGLPLECRDASPWVIVHSFSQAIIKELGQKWSTRTWTDTYVGCQHCRWWLNPLYHIDGP